MTTNSSPPALDHDQPADWVRHRLVGLTKLMEITRRLAAQTELGPILEIITAGACQALECERASLFLYDEKRRELYTRVTTDLEIHEIRTSIDTGFNGWVGRNKRPLNVADPAGDERWNSSIDRQTGFQTRNILAAPLISPRDERLLGTLELLNKKSGQAFDQADENLLLAFAAHAAVSLERVELLENFKTTREIEISLEAARKLQAGFLPQRLPSIEGYELAAWWQPAQGVAGDYYDVVRLPDGRLALAVADVSGHGLGPSLIMASARAMLHVLSRTVSDPARILTLVNETLTPDLKLGRFVTFFLGRSTRAGTRCISRTRDTAPPSTCSAGPAWSATWKGRVARWASSSTSFANLPGPSSWNPATWSCSPLTARSSSGTRKAKCSAAHGSSDSFAKTRRFPPPGWWRC